MIITEDMVRKALDLVGPAAVTLLFQDDLTWGPRYVKCSVRAMNLPVARCSFGDDRKWDSKWGEYKDFAKIADRKRHECERGKANTSVIVALRPWILRDGDYLYSGGAYRDGISVGVSGAMGRTDEAIAELIINHIILLAHLETDRRITAHQMRV